MGKLRFGTGGVRVEMDDTLDQIYRQAVERLAPGLLPRIESTTEEVFTAAREAWPVKTGRSRDGLEHHVTITPDHTQVRGSITNPVDYARFIKAKKLDGKSAFVELLRKPLAERADELAEQLASDTVEILKRSG